MLLLAASAGANSRIPDSIQSNNRKKMWIGLQALPTLKTNKVDSPKFPEERRSMPRLRVHCDAELIAGLSILDVAAQENDDTLVFLGVTKDLSAQGLGLVLPSTQIDERYCNESNSLKVSLHLPECAVGLEVNPVRCEPLNPGDSAQGYLMGAKILRVTSHMEAFALYLQTCGNLIC